MQNSCYCHDQTCARVKYIYFDQISGGLPCSCCRSGYIWFLSWDWSVMSVACNIIIILCFSLITQIHGQMITVPCGNTSTCIDQDASQTTVLSLSPLQLNTQQEVCWNVFYPLTASLSDRTRTLKTCTWFIILVALTQLSWTSNVPHAFEPPWNKAGHIYRGGNRPGRTPRNRRLSYAGNYQYGAKTITILLLSN